MSTPVVERIAIEIRKRLNPVFPDRNRTLGTATIVRTGRVVPDGVSIVIQQGPSNPLPKLDYPGNPPAKAYEVVFNINCFIGLKPSEVEFSTSCNAVVAEVVAAITTPTESPVTWFTFGGLAINANIGSSKDLPSEIAVNGGVSIPLTVHYRVAQNDHSQVR